MQDTGGYNRWNIERNYGGWQSTPLVHLSAQGRVGINQASPEGLLHIDGGSNDPYIYIQRSGAGDAPLDLGGIFFKNDTKLSALIKCRTIDRDDAELIFETMYQDTRAEKLRIKNDGKLMTQSAGWIYTSSSAGSLTLGGGNTNLGGKIVLSGGNSPATGDIRFYASMSSGHTPTERLRIGSDGTVYVNKFTTNNVSPGGMKIQTAAVNGIAWALNLRNPDVTAAGNAAVGIQFNMDRSPSGGIEFQAGSIICRKNQNWTTTPTTVESDMVFGVQKDETHVNRFIIYADGMTETNGVHEFNAAFMLSNNTAYNWDINVESEGSRGNSFYVVAGYNHFHTTTYGAQLVGIYCARQTSITRNANIADVSHSYAGQWSVSKSDNNTLRITKSAGSYGGTGYGFIRVTFQQL
tara:strand:+ start:1 stop:1224 length:1224 start_codon:yes stop_codon:yes gene_type:complete